MISFVLPPLLAEMSMGDLDIPQRFKRGAHYAALLSELDGTAAVPWFRFLFISPVRNPLNSSIILSLYLNLTLLFEEKVE